MSDKIDDKDKKDSVELIEGLRKAYEKSEADGKAFEEKSEKRFAELEEKNQELVKKQLDDEKALADAKEDKEAGVKRMDDLEKKVLRMPAGGGEDNAEAKAEIKAFEKFVTSGPQSLTPEEVKYLRTDVDTDGGFLAPSEQVLEIIKKITEISDFRALVRIRTTSRKSVEIPSRTSIPTAFRVGQGATDIQSQSAYGMEVININRLTTDIPISIEQLSDSAFSMESEINQDAAEAFAVTEGAEFVSGDGVNEFEGILTNADVAEFNSGIANALTGDSLVRITGQLKSGYTGRYIMNRRTLVETMILKDGQGRYLWQNNLAAGMPSLLNGLQYVSTIDMPDIAADAYPVAFGDFQKGYTLVDHTATTLLRDPFTLSRQGKVVFIMHRRNGGKVVLAEAIKKLKIAV